MENRRSILLTQLVFLTLLIRGMSHCQAQLPHESQDDLVHVNQIQVIGTHNSYHAGLAPSQAAITRQDDPALARALDYKHPSLDVQLSNGVRQLELDVLYDPDGGRYAHPAGLARAAKASLPADPPFDPKGVFSKPGYKVMHNPDYDYRSNCQPFVACLEVIREWSRAHPSHLPIFVFVENKKFQNLTTQAMDDLDAEIASVFSSSELITPDDVRQNYPTLNEAVTKRGWPTLRAARGRIIFLLAKSELRNVYREGHSSLEGRILFTNSTLGEPDAAFTVLPESSDVAISRNVKNGYLVLTRADVDTMDARKNEATRRDRALASGAQLISTDYPPGEPATWSTYQVSFGKLVARCNPVLPVKGCNAQLLEEAGQPPYRHQAVVR